MTPLSPHDQPPPTPAVGAPFADSNNGADFDLTSVHPDLHVVLAGIVELPDEEFGLESGSRAGFDDGQGASI